MPGMPGPQQQNPFTPGGNPFTPAAAVPKTTKPRQLPGGGAPTGPDAAGPDPTQPAGAPGAGPTGGDSNVPQNSPPSAGAASQRAAMLRDILASNPTLGVRQADLLAGQVQARFPRQAANPQRHNPQMGLNDPRHPYWQTNPFPTQFAMQPQVGFGGRTLQAHPQSQHPHTEDALNRAVQWAAPKVKQRFQQYQQNRQQRQQTQQDRTRPLGTPPTLPASTAPAPAPASTRQRGVPPTLPASTAPAPVPPTRRRGVPPLLNRAALVYGAQEG